MELLGIEQGTNVVIGILTLIGVVVVIIAGVLNKLGWITIGRASANGGHQMSVKELAKFIEENVVVKECPAHGPMIKAQEKLAEEVGNIHDQQIKNVEQHIQTRDKINGMRSEFNEIKVILTGIDKKVAILACLMNKGKFYHDNSCGGGE